MSVTVGPSPELVSRMVNLYLEGWSLRQIGWEVGYSHTAVRAHLLGAGVALRPRGCNRTF